MRIEYNGIDIAPDVSLQYAAATDTEGGCGDSVCVQFTDVDELWPRWRPVQGDTLRLVEGQFDSGIMYVDRIALSDGACELEAVSIPPDARGPRYQAWESIAFGRLAAEIAQRHALSVSIYDAPDVTYPRLQQYGEGDLEYLAHRCTLEGCAMKVRSGTLVIYDQRVRESSAPVKSIDLGRSVGYFYEDRAADRLKSYAVLSGAISALCRDESGEVCRGGARAERKTAAYSVGEAQRYARGLLRGVNKMARTLTLTCEMENIYAAGEVVTVEGNRLAAGRWFVSRVDYDFTANTVRLKLRGCLDW